MSEGSETVNLAGIHGAAMLNYVMGFEEDFSNGIVRLAPHIADGWDRVSFDNAPFGPYFFDAEVAGEHNRRTVTIDNGQGPGNHSASVARTGRKALV